MIIKKKNVEEQDGKYLINETNLNLAITDANQKGITLDNFKREIYVKVCSYLAELLFEIDA